jgi:hypothetical protein
MNRGAVAGVKVVDGPQLARDPALGDATFKRIAR